MLMIKTPVFTYVAAQQKNFFSELTLDHLIFFAILVALIFFIIFIFQPHQEIKIITKKDLDSYLSKEEQISQCIPFLFQKWTSNNLEIHKIINENLETKMRHELLDFQEFKKFIEQNKKLHKLFLEQISEDIIIYYCKNLYLQKEKTTIKN